MTQHPPPTVDQRPMVVTRHGEEFHDPYAWLRDRDDPAVVAHLAAENAHTGRALSHLEGLRADLFEELRSRIVETDASAPVPEDGWVYYHRTIAGQDYRIHCRRPDAPRARVPVDANAPPADEQVLLDENLLAADVEYLSVGGLAVSPDHRWLAHLVDTTGAERHVLTIRDLDSGDDVEHVVADASYGLAWSADSTHLYYVTSDAAWRPHRVWRHALGRPGGPEHDDLVLQEDDERFWLGIGATRSRDLVLVHLGSKSTSEVHVLDAHDPAARPRVVWPRREGVEYEAFHDAARDRLVILTNRDGAVDFRIEVADIAAPQDAQVLVPHRPGVRVTDVDVFASHFVVGERTQARTQLRVVDPVTGRGEVVDTGEEIATTITGPMTDYHAQTLRYVHTSLVTPTTVVDLDLDTGERTTVKQQEVPGGYDPGLYVGERRWATAADGTRVPVSVVRRVDAPLDGTGACLLYGYGAYEISIDPSFAVHRLSLLDRGVTCAIAHVRGGGELGRGWYEQGRFAHKPNTFTDFVAAADMLVAEGVCARDRLAIEGGSAGGLLVGASLNLRPDLCRAAVAQVPFVDVLNTMSDPTLPLTIPEYEEWGDPGDVEAFVAIRGYSPYDNVVAGADYPALLVTGGLNDPRVGYWEPAKWVARLREQTSGTRPILLQMELGAGHGGPSGRYDSWRERALFSAFVLDQVEAV